jgi:hypothetical protein
MTAYGSLDPRNKKLVLKGRYWVIPGTIHKNAKRLEDWPTQSLLELHQSTWGTLLLTDRYLILTVPGRGVQCVDQYFILTVPGRGCNMSPAAPLITQMSSKTRNCHLHVCPVTCWDCWRLHKRFCPACDSRMIDGEGLYTWLCFFRCSIDFVLLVRADTGTHRHCLPGVCSVTL